LPIEFKSKNGDDGNSSKSTLIELDPSIFTTKTEKIFIIVVYTIISIVILLILNFLPAFEQPIPIKGIIINYSDQILSFILTIQIIYLFIILPSLFYEILKNRYVEVIKNYSQISTTFGAIIVLILGFFFLSTSLSNNTMVYYFGIQPEMIILGYLISFFLFVSPCYFIQMYYEKILLINLKIDY
jgi:hypothetical protein